MDGRDREVDTPILGDLRGRVAVLTFGGRLFVVAQR